LTAPILRPPGDFAPRTVATVARLLELLGEINDHRYLGPRLVLHGSTALNVFHLGMLAQMIDPVSSSSRLVQGVLDLP
jgi:hypothetical protein